LALWGAGGRASGLVPRPTASHNHQKKNARVFSDAEAAFLLKQGAGAGEQLAHLIRELMSQPERLAKMEHAVTAFYRPDAANQIVENLSHA
jgi:UDP-N-acetylglucosamine--N-acetylmuramyl-(pentapeptide) pyrophosphoryl-undecaprenol N-acetylglucosamine transferase